MAIILRFRRLLSLKALVALCTLYFIYLTTSSVHTTAPSYSDSESTAHHELRATRKAYSRSVSGTIMAKQKELRSAGFFAGVKNRILNRHSGPPVFKGEDAILLDWNQRNSNDDRLKKCQIMISTMYFQNPIWNNTNILKFYNQDGVDNTLVEILGESVRIFNYCFLEGGLDAQDVFNAAIFQSKGIDAWDYQIRMFPFFDSNFEKESKIMWPRIIDVSFSKDSESNYEAPDVKTTALNFNINFWSNWAKLAQGKGIVTTMAVSDVPTFAKQLLTFQEIKNTLPIQLVTTGVELTDEFINEIKSAAAASNQHVTIIDCSPFLSHEFSTNYIKNFFNKWIAVLLNTFEEAIFIDVDAVVYQDTLDFFSIPKYKETGIYMYQDRTMPDEHTFNYCTEMLGYMAPSQQEEVLLGSVLSVDTNSMSLDASVESRVYDNFFNKLRLHHVDSGLVILHKSRKLNGLLTSFMLHLDAKMQRCVYGDKEIFWLGELFAGEKFSIDPFEGGVVGPIGRSKDAEPGTSNEISVCGTQIAHEDIDGKLVWTNGGLKACKIRNAAQNDFQKDPDYFTARYGTVENLESLYDSPLSIQGFISPDPFKKPWMQIAECAAYMYCAFYDEGASNDEIGGGKLIEFSGAEQERYINIAKIWNM